MKTFLSIKPAAILRWLACLALFGAAQVALAAAADISNVPPSTLTSSVVRPNLMFVLDDSGSMGNDYLPDDVTYKDGLKCFGYYGYNRIFYNPAINYKVPRDGRGGDYAAASFTGAKSDGFNSSSGTVDLSKPANLKHKYVASGPTTIGYCTKGTSGCSGSSTTDSSGLETVISVSCSKNSSCTKTKTTYQHFYYATLNSGFTNDCTDTHYTAVISSTGMTAAEQQNYANWYQYYRYRMLMMRSASGRVFDAIDPTRFRVGFSTISYAGVSDSSSDFLNVADFDANDSNGSTHKINFFSKLYTQTPSGSTPLRPALEKAGKYFARKVSNQTIDPMQYSCQRNFTLLSTDGYWNTAAEPVVNGTPYVPKRLDGTPIDDVDGVSGVARPMYDAAHAKNSLSDMTKYYFDTDLRTVALGNCDGAIAGQNVCTNKTTQSGDVLAYQNMSTFTLGLGVPGMLNYQSNYDTATSGDFHDIVTGAKDWPDPLSSSNGGYADPNNTVTSRIDDLWHAAVNAGGHYYSAGDPDQLVLGLTDALEKINVEAGSSAGAATSTLQPVVGDDWVFLPKYETQTWVGDIAAYHFQIDNTGAISVSSTVVWSAATQLAAQSSRRILFFDGSRSNNLNDFNYSNLSSTQKGYFDNLCLAGAFKLSQCAELNTNQLSRVTGANVVDYLRGNKQYEMLQSSIDDRVFRSRLNQKGAWTPLGDVIDSAPVYVRVPPFKYADTGYADFKAAQGSRAGMVYVGANDGMLHAFSADTGVEQWAYVPSQVMPNMYTLADSRYSTTHRYFVDATPVVADVYDGSKWRTILVGGFAAGGRGYYALDITDPTSPVGLWEFNDTNMGLSFGRPVVTKNKAGTWLVAFTSGYNNTSGDGNGWLYTVNAITGAPVSSPIPTLLPSGAKAGSASTPSNLGQINAWVEKAENNTALRIYGGDLLGNIWRFDFDDNVAPSGKEALLLGTAKGPTGLPQPISVPPLLSDVGTNSASIPVVTVGTGRYLGQSDMGNTDVQSIYSVKDTLGTTTIGSSGAGLRGDAGMVRQQMNSSHVIPTPSSVDWATNNGWYVDLDQSSGERVNVEMDLQLGVITVATTVPTPTPCSPGGTSWLYYFSVDSGKVLSVGKMDVVLVGVFNVLQNAGTDSQKMVTVWTGSDQSFGTKGGPDIAPPGSPPPPGAAVPRRTSWRELVN